GPWPRPGLGATGPAAVAAAPAVQGVRVNASGYVSLPQIGLVRAEGFTPTELEAEIARRLVEAGILRAPQVSVQIAEYRSRVVAVVGSVERPGLYPLTRPRATLSDLVWAAGGPTKDAGRVVEFVPVGGSTASGPGQTAPAKSTPSRSTSRPSRRAARPTCRSPTATSSASPPRLPASSRGACGPSLVIWCASEATCCSSSGEVIRGRRRSTAVPAARRP